jgi:hypothetical protein
VPNPHPCLKCKQVGVLFFHSAKATPSLASRASQRGFFFSCCHLPSPCEHPCPPSTPPVPACWVDTPACWVSPTHVCWINAPAHCVSVPAPVCCVDASGPVRRANAPASVHRIDAPGMLHAHRVDTPGLHAASMPGLRAVSAPLAPMHRISAPRPHVLHQHLLVTLLYLTTLKLLTVRQNFALAIT